MSRFNEDKPMTADIIALRTAYRDACDRQDEPLAVECFDDLVHARQRRMDKRVAAFRAGDVVPTKLSVIGEVTHQPMGYNLDPERSRSVRIDGREVGRVDQDLNGQWRWFEGRDYRSSPSLNEAVAAVAIHAARKNPSEV